MYRAGYGVERNDVEAVKWLRLAAEQGKTDAAYYLGYIFQSGEQISSKDAQRGNDERKVLVRNPVEAARWYRLAVDHGHTGAMVNLGYLYRQGLGVEKNPAEAVRLFKTAAASVRTNRTDPTPSMAAINLALAYQTGDIVPQDYAAAAQWAEDALASPALPPDLEIAAAGLLASYYSEGRGVAQDLEKAKALKARAAAAVEKLHRQQVPKP
jgi:TPR repeat protein